MSGTLYIARHGESEWNARGVWTGTTDVHLSPKGFKEAELLGQAIKGIKLDFAYCSQQVRTLETLEAMLDASGNVSVEIKRSADINERDYGVYTGKNKWQVQKEVGEDVFEDIRRGWNVSIQDGETLKDVYDRAVPFYKSEIVPKLQSGQNILIVAHGNSIRSLMKYIESISDELISKTEMIFGEILVYTIDKDGKQTSKEVLKIDTSPPPA